MEITGIETYTIETQMHKFCYLEKAVLRYSYCVTNNDCSAIALAHSNICNPTYTKKNTKTIQNVTRYYRLDNFESKLEKYSEGNPKKNIVKKYSMRGQRTAHYTFAPPSPLNCPYILHFCIIFSVAMKSKNIADRSAPKRNQNLTLQTENPHSSVARNS